MTKLIRIWDQSLQVHSPSSIIVAIEPEKRNLPPLNLLDNLNQIVWRKAIHVDPHSERQEIDEVVDIFVRLARLHPAE